MGQVYAVTERVYDASPEQVFDALADYQNTREGLLPAQYSEYEVREGGKGDGTVVHWRLQATEKRVRDCLFSVTEPSPGRLVETDANSTLVITCSALRRRYRETLRAACPDVRFVHLSGSRELIGARMAARSGHFMPVSLLDSQFAALEPLAPDERGVVLDVAEAPDQLVAEAARLLGGR